MTTTETTTATESQTLSREEFDAMLADRPASSRDQAWAAYQDAIALSDKIKAAGLTLSYRKHLQRLSKVRVYAGRLQDAVCHYELQVTIAGNTYPVKDALKAAGYRWDAGSQLWARRMTVDGGSIHDHLEAARHELAGILG
jgi:hypothetical protein